MVYCPIHYGDELSFAFTCWRTESGARNEMKIIFHVSRGHSQISQRYFTLKLHSNWIEPLQNNRGMILFVNFTMEDGWCLMCSGWRVCLPSKIDKKCCSDKVVLRKWGGQMIGVQSSWGSWQPSSTNHFTSVWRICLTSQDLLTADSSEGKDMFNDTMNAPAEDRLVAMTCNVLSGGGETELPGSWQDI